MKCFLFKNTREYNIQSFKSLYDDPNINIVRMAHDFVVEQWMCINCILYECSRNMRLLVFSRASGKKL